ncbi:sigma-54-dependent Fis family transcriptional regulator [bacterium]|nr:sigma-54-dependent Fis family transcriptional regulator [bacterium]
MSAASKKIFILDDEEMIRDLLSETFIKDGYEVDTAMNGREALLKLERTDFDLLITDLRLPDISGMEVLEEVREKYIDMGIIMITAFGSIKNAVRAMKIGAFDYITKPFNLDEIELVVKKYFDFQNLVVENKRLRKELDRKFSFKNIVGNSSSMQQIFDSISMVSQSRATVLIQGASGSGKELVARAIHYNSNRKNNPFITTNCAALPEGLVESELFGHEKGAFTGAIKTTKGRFEQADTGTLLLDEISEISIGMQAKLLRVLQEREIERVGAGRLTPVDVRIIATTNRDLELEVREGRFREDLFYRLNVVPLYMPPITKRREDIPLLINHFVKKFNDENIKNVEGVSEDAMIALSDRDWPGNVREIENCVERAVVMCKPETKFLENHHFHPQARLRVNNSSSIPEGDITLREVEKQLILRTLDENGANRTKTADILGISVRTLRNKLNEYRQEGIDI